MIEVGRRVGSLGIRLNEQNMLFRWPADRELIVCCLHEDKCCHAPGILDHILSRRFRTLILELRTAIGKVESIADFPIPFFFVHFLCLVSAICLPLLLRGLRLRLEGNRCALACWGSRLSGCRIASPVPQWAPHFGSKDDWSIRWRSHLFFCPLLCSVPLDCEQPNSWIPGCRGDSNWRAGKSASEPHGKTNHRNSIQLLHSKRIGMCNSCSTGSCPPLSGNMMFLLVVCTGTIPIRDASACPCDCAPVCPSIPLFLRTYLIKVFKGTLHFHEPTWLKYSSVPLIPHFQRTFLTTSKGQDMIYGFYS